MAEIDAKIKTQGDKIRELKAAKSAKDVIEPEVKILLALKAEFKVYFETFYNLGHSILQNVHQE